MRFSSAELGNSFGRFLPSRGEEKALIHFFGDEYQNYRKKVYNGIPFLDFFIGGAVDEFYNTWKELQNSIAELDLRKKDAMRFFADFMESKNRRRRELDDTNLSSKKNK